MRCQVWPPYIFFEYGTHPIELPHDLTMKPQQQKLLYNPASRVSKLLANFGVTNRVKKEENGLSFTIAKLVSGVPQKMDL